MASLGQLVGDSASIAAVREQAGRLLRSGAGAWRRLPPILILGETGTGKGLLAGAIHAAGPRAAGPFVDINCSAIPEALLEAEPFGFERGAFTDARQAKPGLFQAANGGTIFLDEVGLLPLGLQSKLLKVIEERSVRRLGSTRSEPLDVSVIAATSEDLPARVGEGRFRADLYHRLAVVTLTLPPLRERGDDVLLLARHFLGRLSDEYGLPPRTLTEEAKRAVLAFRWPGNVRELANVLERAVLMTDAPAIDAASLGLPAAGGTTEGDAGGPPGGSVADASDEAERAQLLEVLRASAWNFTRAAAQLGVPRNTLRYRAERLGLTRERPAALRRGGRPPTARRPHEPTASGAESAPPSETLRVTLLQARLVAGSAEVSAAETGRAVAAIADKVRTFGGRVEELGPHGVLAAFGTVPEEDAPLRAAHAGIAVQKLAARAQAADLRLLGVKVALHTAALSLVREGDVVVLDRDGRQAVGRTLDDLLEIAGAGTVVASPAAAHFLARRFDLEPLSEAHGARAAVRVLHQSERGRTRFVGRERELRLLAECLAQAASGQGQVMLIVGEPGIGKSRLLREFRQRVGGPVAWIEGQALAHGRATPFHPVIDMVRRVFRIDDNDAEAVVIEKIERGVLRLGEDARHTLPFLRYLLSIDPGDPAVLAMDPKLRHAEIVRASHALLERGARLRPHVVVLEDAHWCDVATEDWITRLVQVVAAQRIFIIVTCRPGYRPPFGGLSLQTGLALSTLSSTETLQIARSLLGADELPPELQSLIVDKAEGNPFFVEELVLSLQEMGAIRSEEGRTVVKEPLNRVAVPDTVEEVILARVRRLDQRLRGVLEIASVIGKNIPFALLHALTDRTEEALLDDLRRLQESAFLFEVRLFPDIEHTFKHALTQDVVYGNLGAEHRRALHARIVTVVERLFRDRLEEHVERLAHHALCGGLWEPAVRYFREAFTKAFDRSANREAVASLEQALVALEHLPRTPETLAAAIDIRLGLRSALLQLGQIRQILSHLREAESLAAFAGDRVRLAWVWTYLTICHLFMGDPSEAQTVGERALTLAEEVGDFGLRITARTPLAHAHRELGEYRRAIQLFGEAIQALSGHLARQRLGQAMPPALYARSMASVCLAELGDFPEAERLGGESADLAETLDLPFGLALARIALGHTHLVQGRLEDAARILGLALELIEARELPTWFPWAAATRGYALALAGSAPDAVRLLEQALERAAALPFFFGHSLWTAWLGHAHLLQGRPDEATRLARDALRLSRERRERGYEAWSLRILGEIAARQGGGALGDAEAFTRQALDLATELGMRPLVVRCLSALGEILRSTGRIDLAREPLAQAARLLEELRMQPELVPPGSVRSNIPDPA